MSSNVDPEIPSAVRFGDRRFAVSVLDLPAKGQDRYVVRDGFAAVADGASPVRSGGLDVGEFAARALGVMADQVADGASLRAAVRAAIGAAAAGERDAAATPAATLIAVQQERGQLNFGGFCDAAALIRLADGRVWRTRHDPVLAHF